MKESLKPQTNTYVFLQAKRTTEFYNKMMTTLRDRNVRVILFGVKIVKYCEARGSLLTIFIEVLISNFIFENSKNAKFDVSLNS